MSPRFMARLLPGWPLLGACGSDPLTVRRCDGGRGARQRDGAQGGAELPDDFVPGDCDDGERNAFETGVDCGGQDCTASPRGEGCALDTDCSSNFCFAGSCRPDVLDRLHGQHMARPDLARKLARGDQRRPRFAVDCRGEHPIVYVLIENVLQSTLVLDDVWVPLYPMVYGNPNEPLGEGMDLSVYFGATPFRFDPRPVLGAHASGLELRWDANTPARL